MWRRVGDSLVWNEGDYIYAKNSNNEIVLAFQITSINYSNQKVFGRILLNSMLLPLMTVGSIREFSFSYVIDNCLAVDTKEELMAKLV